MPAVEITAVGYCFDSRGMHERKRKCKLSKQKHLPNSEMSEMLLHLPGISYNLNYILKSWSH